MDINSLAQPHILKQPVYVTGKPIAYTAREFGLDPESIDKLASNENPFGPSPKGVAAAQDYLKTVNLYPDGGAYDLIGKIAEFRGMKREQIAVGNGSNEILTMLGKVFLGPDCNAVMSQHSFAVYKLTTMAANSTVVEVPMSAPAFKCDLKAMRAAVTDKTRLVFLANPNNPTGSDLTAKEILDFADSLPETCILVMDEAYTEFIEDQAPDFRSRINEGKNIICCRTFSKIYGLAGLRVGYCIARPEIIGLINRVRDPFNVNSIAQAAACAAIDDQEYVNFVRKENKEGLKQLMEGFEQMGLPYVKSQANFISVGGFKDPMDAFQALQRMGTIVRPQPQMGDILRITVGTKEQNERLLKNIKAYLGK